MYSCLLRLSSLVWCRGRLPEMFSWEAICSGIFRLTAHLVSVSVRPNWRPTYSASHHFCRRKEKFVVFWWSQRSCGISKGGFSPTEAMIHITMQHIMPSFTDERRVLATLHPRHGWNFCTTIHQFDSEFLHSRVGQSAEIVWSLSGEQVVKNSAGITPQPRHCVEEICLKGSGMWVSLPVKQPFSDCDLILKM